MSKRSGGSCGITSTGLERFTPGHSIPAARLNSYADAIERTRTIFPGQGSGLNVTQLPNGVATVATPGFALSIARTTSIITAASGSTLGTGTIQIETGSGTSIDDPGGTPPTFTVYSNDDQRVGDGKYVVVAPFRDGYILLHARCGDLL